MQTLTIVELKKFEAKLIELNFEYDLSGRKDFDVAYDANLSLDRSTLNEVEFKKDLAALKEKSSKKEAELRVSMGVLRSAITEAKRQIELDSSVSMAMKLIS